MREHYEPDSHGNGGGPTVARSGRCAPQTQCDAHEHTDPQHKHPKPPSPALANSHALRVAFQHAVARQEAQQLRLQWSHHCVHDIAACTPRAPLRCCYPRLQVLARSQGHRLAVPPLQDLRLPTPYHPWVSGGDCVVANAKVRVRFPAAASPPHMPREDGLAHPAEPSRSNLAAALCLLSRWRLSKP
jgi:hypothetical protein